jgi:hypothetical protein
MLQGYDFIMFPKLFVLFHSGTQQEVMCNVKLANFIGGWMDVFHPVPKHDKHTEIIIHWNIILEFDKQKENKKMPQTFGIMFSSWKAFFR